jgi:hypothetical protein
MRAIGLLTFPASNSMQINEAASVVVTHQPADDLNAF